MTALRGSEGPNKRQNWRERIQRESNNMPSTRNSPHAPRMFWGEAASGFPRAGTGCVRRQLVQGPVSWVESRLPGRWSLSRKPGDGPPPARAAAERSSHSPKQSRVCSHPANSRGERPTEDSQRTRQAPDRRGGLLDTPTRPGEHGGPTALELARGTGYTRPGAGQEMRRQLAATPRPGGWRVGVGRGCAFSPDPRTETTWGAEHSCPAAHRAGLRPSNLVAVRTRVRQPATVQRSGRCASGPLSC